MSVESLFNLALEVPPSERSTFLDKACGDDNDLRRRVEVLLGAHDNPGSFLAGPALSPPRQRDTPHGPTPLKDGTGVSNGTDISAPITEKPGTSIGPYHLLQMIGEGGMGVVFLAKQTRPVRRQVALKIIKPGMDSHQVVTRFEAERQALAMMDHPNIAKVLDGGETPTGSPYFVMELVNGAPLHRYCDDRRLPVHHRLELFVSVCQAVQHAHQKGLIHRDLKPTNVIVTEYDGQPAPKVIDFGIAKAVDRRSTLHTNAGMLIGTPEYMSPEQAEPTTSDIDTRSDIYSLGVMLYEMLTGETPFARQSLNASIWEVLRVIREEEPAAPSACLSTVETLAELATRRATEPDRLVKQVRGDLDWIVLKALEKDRARRYETAAALSEDVRHYLNNEPVQAGPPSNVYRLRKFVRRNRGKVIAASMVLLTLLTGIVGTTVGMVRATIAETQATEDRDQAVKEKRRADDEAAVAQEVSDFLQNDLLRVVDTEEQAVRQEEVRLNLTVREALDRAAARIGDRFQDRPLVEAAIRDAIGDAYKGIGEARLGVPHMERAVALRKAHLSPGDPKTLSAMRGLAVGYFKAGQISDALQVNREVLRLRRTSQGRDDPDLRFSRDILIEAYHGGASLADALKLHEETLELQKAAWGLDHFDTLDSMRGLITGYHSAGRIDDAVLLCEQALPLFQATHGRDHARTILCMDSLAELYRRQGRLTQAISLRRQCVEMLQAMRGRDHPETLHSMFGLAVSYVDAGDLVEGAALHEEILKLRQAKLGADHPYTLRSMTQLVNAWELAQSYSKAEPLYRELLVVEQSKFGSNHPEVAAVLNRFSRNLIKQSKYADAEPLLREGLAIWEKGPEDWQTAHARYLLGWARLGQGQYADAEPLLLQAYDGLTQHQANLPKPCKSYPVDALERVVELYEAWGRTDQAAVWRAKLDANFP